MYEYFGYYIFANLVQVTYYQYLIQMYNFHIEIK
jgi:hypothetical protein